jgi:hypothetical protein
MINVLNINQSHPQIKSKLHKLIKTFVFLKVMLKDDVFNQNLQKYKT